MRDASGRQLSSVEERRVRMLEGVTQAAQQAKTQTANVAGVPTTDVGALTHMIANIVILVVEEVKASNGL